MPCFVISTYNDHRMVAVSSSEVGFMILTLETIQLLRVRLYQPDFQWLQTLTNVALMSSLLLGFRASRLAVPAFAASMRCASSLS